MNASATNDTSSVVLWYNQRQSVFAFVGLIFFLSVIIFCACSGLIVIAYSIYTECGQKFKRISKEIEKTIRWKKNEEFKIDLPTTLPNPVCPKLMALLECK